MALALPFGSSAEDDGYSPQWVSDDACATEADAGGDNSRKSEADLTGPLAFVEKSGFQSFIGVVISANILALWGETDAPGLLVWPVLDNLFLLVFIAELWLRTASKRLLQESYFRGKDRRHALFDVFIVCIGVFDLWISPVLLRDDSGSRSETSVFLRFLRLFRLARMLRIFRMFAVLSSFATALIEMLETMMWIALVLLITLFTAAVVLVHLLGHGEALPLAGQGWEEEVAVIGGYFRDIGTALFTLFQLTTADNWDMIANPVITINPWWRMFFVVFIIFASWIILSVLTAEASDRMISATTDRKELEARVQEAKHREFINFLRDSFLDADTDGNGSLDLEEFQAMMEKDFVHKRMQTLGISLSRDDFLAAFHMLDIDDSGELTIEEFVDGLGYLQEGLATKHIVNVDYTLKRVERRVEDGMSRIIDTIGKVTAQHHAILHRIRKQESLHSKHQLSLWLWQQWALNTDRGIDGFSPDMLRAGPVRPTEALACEPLGQVERPPRRTREGATAEAHGNEQRHA